MSAWTDALTDERKAKAQRYYEQLKAIGWDKLSKNDRKVMMLLGWFCLEEDDSGEPRKHIECDLGGDDE